MVDIRGVPIPLGEHREQERWGRIVDFLRDKNPVVASLMDEAKDCLGAAIPSFVSRLDDGSVHIEWRLPDDVRYYLEFTVYSTVEAMKSYPDKPAEFSEFLFDCQ